MEPEEEVHLINNKNMSMNVLRGSGRDIHRDWSDSTGYIDAKSLCCDAKRF